MKQSDFYQSLKKKSEIQEIFSRGKIIKSTNLLIKYRYINSESYGVRVLLAVPSRIRPVVTRNRYKRVLRHVLFEAIKSEVAQNGLLLKALSFAIIPRPGYVKVKYSEKIREMKKIICTLMAS